MQHRRRLSFATRLPDADLFGHGKAAPKDQKPPSGHMSGQTGASLPRAPRSCDGAGATVTPRAATTAPAARAPSCWVAAHLPDLSLEAFVATLDAQARERPVALQDRSGIVAVDPAAAALGVRPTDVDLFFFPRFFEFMIFTDVFLLIVSLAYYERYEYLFRNAGFVISTVLLRVSLSTPKPYDLLLALTAMLYGLAVLAVFAWFSAIAERTGEDRGGRMRM